MPATRSPFPAARPITVVEQETGLSRDVLRAWERRYGFPAPLRDGQGSRFYPEEQVDRLRLWRSLVDMGERPGKLALLDASQLEARLRALRDEATPAVCDDHTDPALAECIALLIRDEGYLLEERLDAEMLRLGVERFTIERAAPLCRLSGEAWERGALQIHQEHMFTRILSHCLRRAIARLNAVVPRLSPLPRVLLTTAPGEIHELGILMVEAMLSAHAVPVSNIGPQTPAQQIAEAALAQRCAVVGLSFSSWFDSRRAASFITAVRRALPEHVALWVGGSNAALRRGPIAGVTIFDSLTAIPAALAEATAQTRIAAR